MVLDGRDLNSDDVPDNTILRRYTLCLDLGGQRAAGFSPRGLSDGATAPGIHGAGGIGGLLALEETAATGSPSYWFFYDANDNVVSEEHCEAYKEAEVD